MKLTPVIYTLMQEENFINIHALQVANTPF